ncbi:MAG: hypothetical protein K2H84_08220 [Paramuribaculum sp.]|nr:hypothetical protein [Paramuribaculum sp.]
MLKNIKRSVQFALLSLVSLFALTACDEDDYELLFFLDKMSISENVQFDHYYTDFSETSTMYWIAANSKESSLVISCAGAASVHIENFEGEVLTEYVSAKGHWSAKVISSNTVVFTFERISPGSDASSITIVDTFEFVAKNKKRTATEIVQVTRLINSDAPLN